MKIISFSIKKKLLFSYLFYILISNKCFSQTVGVTNNLINFLRQNFDTSIIYAPDNLYVISKKAKSVFYFTYSNPYISVEGRNLPQDLTKKFLSENMLFKRTVPDTNRYFLPFQIKYPFSANHWQEIMQNDLWNLKDDAASGYVCDSLAKNKGCNTDDGITDKYLLITKSGIKLLSFYAASFYENCCPGNVNRIKEIKIANIYKKIFKL